MAKLPYPRLKPNSTAEIRASAGITINGAESTQSWSGPIFYNEHHKWVQDDTGKRVESAGKIFIFHDIFSGLDKLTGLATIRGTEYTFWGSRFYNPDGTVHHVELWLK